MALGFAGGGVLERSHADPWRPIVISVQVMFDRGAHSGRGLGDREISTFKACQEKARREYATSGLHFDVRVLEGAYLRQQGYSQIPDKFLAPGMINLFVTETLGYDIDRDRTGGLRWGRAPLAGAAEGTRAIRLSWACETRGTQRSRTSTPITSR